jgi:hypothetical protein
VEDALQAFPGKDPYTLSILEDVKSDTLGQQSRRNKMGLKNKKQPVFDHKDVVNITNAVQDIRPFLSDEDQDALEEAGLAVRFRMLYKAVTDPAVRQQVDPMRIKPLKRFTVNLTATPRRAWTRLFQAKTAMKQRKHLAIHRKVSPPRLNRNLSIGKRERPFFTFLKKSLSAQRNSCIVSETSS